MDTYRIRRAGAERSVGDAAALLALAHAGDLRPTDEVLSGGVWVRASDLPMVRGHLRRPEDPWAAWSDLDAVDARSIYREMVDKPDELPGDALTPVGDHHHLDELPAVALEVVDDPATDPGARTTRPPASARPPARPEPRPRVLPFTDADRELPRYAPSGGGELIDFPPRTRPAVELPQRPARTPKPVPLVRGSRVAAMVVAGGLLLLLAFAWMQASSVSLRSSPRAGASTADPQAADPGAPLRAMEQELRSTLTPTPRLIAVPGDFTNALTVELVQQRVDIRTADGNVTKWIGRKGDEPRIAEVRIVYRSRGEISRELGAIGLVVGRYKRLYRLDMPVFEVTEEGTGGTTKIDPERAEAFYQARITLQAFLQSLT
jgi:hypothetical protein